MLHSYNVLPFYAIVFSSSIALAKYLFSSDYSKYSFSRLLQGLDQLRSGLLQQQKPFIQAPQPFHQLQMLTPQHQQQLLLAQQNLTSPSANDLESRRLRMLLNNRNMSLGKDPLSNSIGDIIPNMGSPMQVNGAGLPRGDPDMLLKVLLLLNCHILLSFFFTTSLF